MNSASQKTKIMSKFDLSAARTRKWLSKIPRLSGERAKSSVLIKTPFSPTFPLQTLGDVDGCHFRRTRRGHRWLTLESIQWTHQRASFQGRDQTVFAAITPAIRTLTNRWGSIDNYIRRMSHPLPVRSREGHASPF